MSVIVGLNGQPIDQAPRTKLALQNDPLGLTPAPKYIAIGSFELTEEQIAAALLAYCESQFGLAVPSEQVDYEMKGTLDANNDFIGCTIAFTKHVPDFGDTYPWRPGERFCIDDGSSEPVTGKIHKLLDRAVVVFFDEACAGRLPDGAPDDRCATIPRTGLRPLATGDAA